MAEVDVVTGDDLEEFTTVGGVIVITEDDTAEVNEVASFVVVTADFIEGKAAIAITEDLKAVDKADSGILTVNGAGRGEVTFDAKTKAVVDFGSASVTVVVVCVSVSES